MTTYEKEIFKWRMEKETSLRSERGWLALEGLYWLEQGTNPFGVSPKHPVILSQGPKTSGVFTLHKDKVQLITCPESPVSISGMPAAEMMLQPDTSGDPTILSLGDLVLMLIQRGDRFGIRIWNTRRPERLNFPGRSWYPVKPEWRLAASFKPAEGSEMITVPDITGGTQDIPLAGTVNFFMNGIDHNLIALDEGDGSLFIIFRDLTSQDDTYPAGRFLYTTTGTGGLTVLDFNKAYNPPCAFTEFATCPLPPPQNWLSFRIEAGERNPT
jgi:uncharacterized protein